jgi:hypothetical protein
VPEELAMTETDWLACTDPHAMLEFLRGRASERKLRLFAVACCRRIFHLLDDKAISRKTLEFAERFADGLATRNELHGHAWGKPGSVFEVIGRQAWDAAKGSTAFAARTVQGAVLRLDPELFEAWEAAFNNVWPRYFMSEAVEMANATMPSGWVAQGRLACDEELKAQTNVLRDIFGNPFRPVAIEPAWLSPNVVALVQTIYDDRAFARMGELADAVDKAGCTNADVPGHCREPGDHVRGCWIVDLLLGKE